MSDIRFNRWLHQSGTGGVSQDSSGNIGIGSTQPLSALDLGTGNIRSHNVHSTGIVTSIGLDINGNADISGNLNVGGVLTYEDVTNIDSVGIVTAQAGINVTGGNVAIGTVTASEKLDVWGTIRASQGPSEYMHLYPVAGAGYFDVSNSTTYPAIVFQQKGSGGTQERLRIDSNGDVGIGNNAPNRKLVISQANSTAYSGTDFDQDYHVLKLNNTTDSKTVGMQFLIGSNGEAAITATESSDGATDLAFGTRGSGSRAERLRITSDGKIGIGGETSPEFKVTVYDAGYSGVTIKSNRTTATDNIGGLHFKTQSTNVAYIQSLVDGSIKFRNTSSLTERLRIDSIGRALLGSQRTYGGGTYYDDLTINNSNTASGAAGGAGIDLVSGNDSWGGYIFSDSDSHARGYIKYDHGDDDMVFGTSGSNRVHINSAGNMGVGNISPTQARLVAQTAGGMSIAAIKDNSGASISLGGVTQPRILMESDPSASDFKLYTAGGSSYGSAGWVERLRITSEGYVIKPYSPSFLARLSNNINIATSGNSDVVFNDEYFDNGNNYNTSNGRFTAPIAGKYFFGIQLYVGFSVTAVRVMHAKFTKNGNVYANADMFGGINADGGTHYHPTGCATAMIDLAANDYVTFNLGSLSTTGSGQALLYGSAGTRFFGYLVG